MFLSRVLLPIRWASLALSALLCGALSVLYILRPDGFAAITINPVWVWLAPGLFLILLGWRMSTKRIGLVVFLMWVLFIGLLGDEPRSLIRSGTWPDPEWRDARASGRALRVVSLNCAAGSAEAAAEVISYEPDIVLLQESPSRSEVERLGERLFGDEAAVVWGADPALIVRGEVLETYIPRESFFVRARVRLKSGLEVEVISTRLTPPIMRQDLWSPECWRAHRENREIRREQMRLIAEQVDSVSEGVPIIAGGDFNAPAGDAVFRLLRPRLRDSFKEAGKGWGNTMINRIPFHRIDQVWISDAFRASAVVARKTEHSDHRMVVCDLFEREGVRTK
ncbi:MAG: endonuclease/exonuclease/phosphatase family protein [Armatimonadetes bacterium]|nr:endonuclease/exonuclease/phosphatase family protein [Armatimonadota bacterium]